MCTKSLKNQNINLRIGMAEKSAIYQAAEAVGIAPAVFVRDAALQRAGGFTSEDHRSLRLILADVGKIGGNINQIARRLNQGGTSDAAALAHLIETLDNIRIDVRQAVQS